jgi:hypothetical protein
MFLSREEFENLTDPEKLLWLYDQILQIRRADVVTGAILEDYKKRLEAIENKRPGKAS